MKTHAKPFDRLLCNGKADPTRILWTDTPGKVSCSHCKCSLRKGIQTRLGLEPDYDTQAAIELETSILEQGSLPPV